MQSGFRQDPFGEERARTEPRGLRTASPGGMPGAYPPPGGDLPKLTIGDALARRWKLVVLITVLGALIGGAVGFSLPPTYTSEAQLNAGSLDAQAQAIPGYSLAAQTLAEAYARVVGTARIEIPVARQTGHSVTYVDSHLTSVNIPNNPIFRIDGTGTSATSARELARVASQLILTYAKTTTTPPGATNALNSYKHENNVAQRYDNLAGLLQSKYPVPDAHEKAAIAAAQQGAAVARLRANAEQSLYVNTISNNTSAAAVTMLSQAGPATSNRKQAVEIAGFAGGVVGCVLICLIVAQLEARRRRKLMQAMLIG